MKVSAIPAQVTTVEDRIAGNLNLKQLLLLASPLFLVAVSLFLLPPYGKYALYKLIIALIISLTSSVLAIRINDKIVLDIIKIRLKFELRPHLYIYRKQKTVLEIQEVQQSIEASNKSKVVLIPKLELSKTARNKSQRLLTDNRVNVVFHSKGGSLNVKVSAI